MPPSAKIRGKTHLKERARRNNAPAEVGLDRLRGIDFLGTFCVETIFFLTMIGLLNNRTARRPHPGQIRGGARGGCPPPKAQRKGLLSPGYPDSVIRSVLIAEGTRNARPPSSTNGHDTARQKPLCRSDVWWSIFPFGSLVCFTHSLVNDGRFSENRKRCRKAKMPNVETVDELTYVRVSRPLSLCEATIEVDSATARNRLPRTADDAKL